MKVSRVSRFFAAIEETIELSRPPLKKLPIGTSDKSLLFIDCSTIFSFGKLGIRQNLHLNGSQMYLLSALKEFLFHQL